MRACKLTLSWHRYFGRAGGLSQGCKQNLGSGYAGSCSFHILVPVISSATVMLWQCWSVQHHSVANTSEISVCTPGRISDFCRSLWTKSLKTQARASLDRGHNTARDFLSKWNLLVQALEALSNAEFGFSILQLLWISWWPWQTRPLGCWQQKSKFFLNSLGAHCDMLCQQIFCLCSFSVLLTLNLLVQLLLQSLIVILLNSALHCTAIRQSEFILRPMSASTKPSHLNLMSKSVTFLSNFFPVLAACWLRILRPEFIGLIQRFGFEMMPS